MEVRYCKICKTTLPISKFKTRKNQGVTSRYRTCDKCREKIYKEKRKNMTKEEKKIECERQLRFLRRRFFYARAAKIIARARKQKRPVTFSCEELCILLARMWRKQKGMCAISGEKLTRDNSNVDHIVSIRDGGGDEIENLRWTTKEYNMMKSGMSEDEFIRRIHTVYNRMKENTPIDIIRELANDNFEGCNGCSDFEEKMWKEGFVLGFILGEKK